MNVFNGFYTSKEPFEGERKIILNFTRHNSEYLSTFSNFILIDIPITIKSETIDPQVKLADLIISKLEEKSLKPDFLPFIILPNHTRLNLPIYLAIAGLFGRKFPIVLFLKQNPLQPQELSIEWLIPNHIMDKVKSRRTFDNKSASIQI
jgi:hypothetical protein